jgi:hypothetical protein
MGNDFKKPHINKSNTGKAWEQAIRSYRASKVWRSFRQRVYRVIRATPSECNSPRGSVRIVSPMSGIYNCNSSVEMREALEGKKGAGKRMRGKGGQENEQKSRPNMAKSMRDDAPTHWL